MRETTRSESEGEPLSPPNLSLSMRSSVVGASLALAYASGWRARIARHRQAAVTRRPRSPPLASRASHRRSASPGFVAALAPCGAALAAPCLTRASARLSRTGARWLSPPASRHAASILALRRMRLGEACLPPSKTGFTPSYLAFWRVTGMGTGMGETISRLHVFAEFLSIIGK